VRDGADPAGRVGSIELLDAQYLVPRTRHPRLAGDERWKGSGARSAPPWQATRFNWGRQSILGREGPPRAYNGLEMSRLAGEGRAAWAETHSLCEAGSS